MASSFKYDSDNSIDESHFETNKNEEEKQLEKHFKSIQVKEANNEIQASTAEGGSTAKYDASFRNFNSEGQRSHKKCKNINSSEVSSKQNESESHFLPAFAQRGVLKKTCSDAPNWRSLRKPISVTKPNSQLSGWRDPEYKYERSMRRDDRNSFSNATNERYGARDNRSGSLKDIHTKPRDKSKMGNWTFSCAPDITLDNGLTEVEHVRNYVKELHEENGELFATQHHSEFESIRGGTKINCFTSNYEDKKHIAKVADVLMEKIREYPYCFYYFYDRKPLYMRTCEGELYEFNTNNWKFIDFNE